MRRCFTLVAVALQISSTSAFAQAVASANPLIDYPGFEKLVREVGPLREARRLRWERFAAEARSKDAILIDARSAADFARGHIAGATNLPFNEFTDARLAEVLGPDRERPIYIYCKTISRTMSRRSSPSECSLRSTSRPSSISSATVTAMSGSWPTWSASGTRASAGWAECVNPDDGHAV